MKVKKLGKGEPEYAVVGSIHGDEPCGKKAIERFLSEDWEIKKPVKFVIANEKALKENERFLDTDLNRCFPGDKDSELHEERLASKLMEELEGLTILDIHSTRSYPEPFSTLKDLEPSTKKLVSKAGVEKAVLFENDSDTMGRYLNAVIVEAGYQGSDQAVENAYNVMVNFLAAQGVIDHEYKLSDPEYFRYVQTVEGDYKFLAENFQKVEKGQVYAKNKEVQLEAEDEFYPVLMSTDGYDGMLGFKAERLESEQ